MILTAILSVDWYGTKTKPPIVCAASPVAGGAEWTALSWSFGQRDIWQIEGLILMDAATLLPAKPRETIAEFRPGDTVRVNVIIREGERERSQAFQGTVIRGSYRMDRACRPDSTFTVRRVSYGIGVERTFLICSPLIESLEVTRRGKVRRARLYYLRGLTGRKARIKERR